MYIYVINIYVCTHVYIYYTIYIYVIHIYICTHMYIYRTVLLARATTTFRDATAPKKDKASSEPRASMC